MKIDFIYFDVGGVVVLDFSKTNKWNQLLADLKIPNNKVDQFNKYFDSKEIDFCIGKEPVDSLVPILKNRFEAQIDIDYSFLTDVVSRFEPNTSLQSIIKNLNSEYKIGLITNMYLGMLDLIFSKGLITDINWSYIVDSSVVGVAKPNNDIFKIACDKAGVKPENILFVENSPMHIKAAKQFGFNTLLYDPSSIEMSNNKLLQTLNS